MRMTLALTLVACLGIGCDSDGSGDPATPDGMTADANGGTDACVGSGCQTQTGNCPAGMVWINSSTCIDAKEATVNDFLEFANSLGAACTDPGPTCNACGGKRCFISNVDNPWHYENGSWYVDGNVGISLQHPARYVTFAAAKSACARKNKHLCRADEWERACSGPTGQAYPYGNAFEAGRCNSASGITGSPWAVGTHATCATTGTPALLDMSGNVWEWTNECSGNNCELRGGSFIVDGSFFPTALSCAGTKSQDISSEVFGTDHDFGYRCCSLPL
jgi:sulfatase modifying factor 1